MRVMSRPLVCQQAIELMSDYLDGSLSWRDRRRLEKHLRGCDACGEYLRQLRVIVSAGGQVQPDDVEPSVMDALLDVFHKFTDETE